MMYFQFRFIKGKLYCMKTQLCSHWPLLQASMVYINTLMIQQVLNEPERLASMTPRDLAALSPLITQHINPYGRFELDMEARLPLSA